MRALSGFEEIADRVYVLRYPVLDVNVTLVVGDGAALVVDTLSTTAQAHELLAAIRAVTPAPLTIVNTHLHFDHCFGNAVLADGGRPVWAHDSVAAALTERGEQWRAQWYAQWQTRNPELAQGLAQTPILRAGPGGAPGRDAGRGWPRGTAGPPGSWPHRRRPGGADPGRRGTGRR